MDVAIDPPFEIENPKETGPIRYQVYFNTWT